MAYKWFFQLSSDFPVFNLFQYVTVRSFLAFFTAFFICLGLAHFFIYKISNHFKEKINSEAPSSHQKKRGTPTLGGIFMLFSLLCAVILWIDVSNPLIQALLYIIFAFSGIGFWDDFLKIKKNNQRGIQPKWRLLIEFLVSLIVLTWLTQQDYISTKLYLPFLKDFSFEMSWLYPFFGAFVITGSANAVNLTDGLDGLAIFPLMTCTLTLALFSYLAGHSEMANYLYIPFVQGASELSPFSAAIVACCLGFLWYNSYPAQVFMGDIGSLGFGSFLGAVAVLTKNEILLVLLGGVFVVETFSVIFQIVSFQLTGRRIFKMAPLHHHFELKGVSESKIIVRFWIVSILLAVLSLTVLKIR